jgi:hypothetical protein
MRMDAFTRRRDGGRVDRVRSRRMLGAIVMSVALGLVASPAANAVLTQGQIYETGVVQLACPSVDQCTATAGIMGEHHPGQVVTFDPLSPGGAAAQTLAAGEDLFDLSCPSTSQCTTGNLKGEELTFDPSNPGTPEPVGLESGIIESVSCPSTTQCTTGDDSSKEATFDPTAPGKPKAVTVGGGSPNGLRLACVSPTQCTAASWKGEVTTFNPQAPGAMTPVVLDPEAHFLQPSCPTSEQCTTLLAESGQELTFNPLAAGDPSPVDVGGGHRLTDLACPSATQCTAVGDYGTEVTFDPTSPGAAIRVQIALGAFPQEHRNLNTIACPSTHQCTTVDDSGIELTFDPTVERPPPPRLISPLPGIPPAAHEPARISRAQIRALLARKLRPTGRQARIGAILKSGGYVFRLAMLEPGVTKIAWYLAPGVRGRAKPSRKRAPLLMAGGRFVSVAAGTKTAKITLTRLGRQHLRRAKRVKLTAEASFAPSGASPLKSSQTFTLVR